MSTGTLENKTAVIYGGSGSLGSTIAKAMAGAGAYVVLAGRNLAPVRNVAEEIVTSGGEADAAVVDATIGDEVDGFIAEIVRKRRTLDLSFCLIDYQVMQNCTLVGMKVEDFIRPVTIAMQSHFLTATAAAKIMMRQRSGVILSLTATPGGICARVLRD